MQVRSRGFLLYRKSSIKLLSLISPQYTGEQNKYPPPPPFPPSSPLLFFISKLINDKLNRYFMWTDPVWCIQVLEVQICP